MAEANGGPWGSGVKSRTPAWTTYHSFWVPSSGSVLPSGTAVARPDPRSKPSMRCPETLDYVGVMLSLRWSEIDPIYD